MGRGLIVKFFFYILILCAAIFVCAYIYGYTLEPVRSGTVSRPCDVSAKDLLETMLDVESQPSWRKDLASVQRINKSSSWAEITQQGEEISFSLLEANERSVSMSFTSDRGYSGRWSAELVPQSPTRTEITAREDVTVKNPIDRIISRLLFNPEEFASNYLDALCNETRIRASK